MASRPVATSPSLLIPPGCGGGSRSPATWSRTNSGIRQVAIERVDDPVAVAPGLAEVALGGQLDQVAGVGVANDIEPVPAPALAVPRRRQQAIDDPRERLGRVVGQEGVDLRRASAAGRSGRRWPVGSGCAGRPAAAAVSPCFSRSARRKRSMAV